jgi:hypothetical protein
MARSDPYVGWNRRRFLQVGAAVTAMASLGWGHEAAAHNLPPGQFGAPVYDKALAMTGGYKAVFQSPNIEASVVVEKRLDHLLLAQVKNWLNGFQFSYQVPPEDLHLVVATYASANLLTYSDPVWQKYRLGEKYNLIDPATGAPAIRNVFWPSRFGEGASPDPDHPQSRYQDTGIEALQKRGVLFLT